MRGAWLVTCLHVGLHMSDGAAEQEGMSPCWACRNESHCHQISPGSTMQNKSDLLKAGGGGNGTPMEPHLLPSATPLPKTPRPRSPPGQHGTPREAETCKESTWSSARRAHGAQLQPVLGDAPGRRSARPNPELSPELPPRIPAIPHPGPVPPAAPHGLAPLPAAPRPRSRRSAAMSRSPSGDLWPRCTAHNVPAARGPLLQRAGGKRGRRGRFRWARSSGRKQTIGGCVSEVPVQPRAQRPLRAHKYI